VISILIPTVPGREVSLAKTLAVFQREGGDLEFIIERDEGNSNWGTKIALAAHRARGDYLFLAADDLDVHEGWWEVATAVCDEGKMPAPLVLNPDGSIQSCGVWGEDMPEGSVIPWSRFPFLSREQWERFGPTLPIHYSDHILGVRAAKQGVECVITHAFCITHHFAPQHRKDNDAEHLRMVMAERLEADGLDVWHPEVRASVNAWDPNTHRFELPKEVVEAAKQSRDLIGSAQSAHP